jgi:hypothetical protein
MSAFYVGVTYSNGRNVGEVSGNTRSVDNIVKGELVDKGRCLEQKG